MKRNVGHLMTSEPVCVTPGTSFKEIVRLMTGHGISALPVVDARNRLAGIVSEGDLILKEAGPSSHEAPTLFEGKRRRQRRMKAAGGVASEVMTQEVITVGPDASIEEAARLMSDRHVKWLPVVYGGGTLVGVLSRVDLLKVFLREDGDIRQEIVERVLMPSVNKGAEEVLVDVEDGVAVLRGHVARRSLADALAECAGGVEGVVGVHNAIEWAENDAPNTYALEWVGSVIGPGRI